MANVIRCASTLGGADALVYKDIGADRDELYITFDVYVPQALVNADAADGYVGDICHITRLGSIITNPFPGRIFIDSSVPSAPSWRYGDSVATVITTVCPRDAWQTVSLHYLKNAVGGFAVKLDAVDYGNASADTPTDQVDGAAIGMNGPPASTEPLYLRNIKFGSTAYGSSDLFSEPGGSLAGFTTVSGDVTVVDDSTIAAPATEGRVGIAFDDGPLVAAPTWTWIDQLYPNVVAGFDLHSGKQTENDRTDTGTATLYLNDTAGLFDPANVSSPYFGKLDSRQITFQVYDPVTLEWVQQWRGHIDDYGYDINPATNAAGEPLVATIQVDCVDIFDYLGGYQLQPYPIDGDIPPTGSPGIVFYEDTAGTVDDRIVQLLTDAGIDSTMYVVFTGNVSVQETPYSPGDAILNALRDAADAEGPFIANIYVDRFGRFVFHGRRSRFAPETVAATTTPDIWTFTRWKVGDGNAIALDADRAQMRVLAYSRARSDIINSASSWPRHDSTEDALVATQVYEDAASIASYAKHSALPMTDLIIKAGVTTGNTKWQETLLYATLVVKNKKDPDTRIRTLTLKALPPGDTRAAATWDPLLRADISDVVNVSAGYPGGTGLVQKEYYIEGRTVRVRPLNTVHDMVEVDLDVSPTVWSMDTHGVFGLSAVGGSRSAARSAGKPGTVHV